MGANAALALLFPRVATEPYGRRSCAESAQPIDVADYLEIIAKQIISGLSMTEKILLQADFPSKLELPLSKAVPLGLIVGELVTNSIKYAHPTGIAGIIRIASSRRHGAIVIEVSDDGIGLPERCDHLQDNDRGLDMIRALAGQVGASVDFDSHGLGLTVTLRMPYAEIAFNAISKDFSAGVDSPVGRAAAPMEGRAPWVK